MILTMLDHKFSHRKQAQSQASHSSSFPLIPMADCFRHTQTMRQGQLRYIFVGCYCVLGAGCCGVWLCWW